MRIFHLSISRLQARSIYYNYRGFETHFLGEDKELYESIVKHRHRYTRLEGVDYNLHQPQSIDFLPSEELTPAWKADYVKMQEQMIHGDSPKYDDLIEALAVLKEKINSVDWKMETEFPLPNEQE